MPQNYTPEFKKKIVRLHEEEGRTYKSITAEYGVSKAAISAWCKQFRDECQKSPELKNEYDYMKETLRLKKENDELRKEVAFLKKAADYAVTKGAFTDTGLFFQILSIKMHKTVPESRTGRICTAFLPGRRGKSAAENRQKISMFCTKPVIMLISTSFPV